MWCRGDRCTVRWAGDGQVYRALVREIRRGPEGHTTALVRFEGYGGEDDEEVSIGQLMTARSRHAKRPSVTQPAKHADG